MTSTRKVRSAKTKTRRALASVTTGARRLRQARELAAATSEPILRRTAFMKKAIQTREGLHNPEFTRMGSEKLNVMLDSWRAAGLRVPAMNHFLMQHWGRLAQRTMTSAVAMASCRSPGAAAAIGFSATTAMLGDVASLNLAMIRWGQGFTQAAAAPVLRMATGNARRLASSTILQRA